MRISGKLALVIAAIGSIAVADVTPAEAQGNGRGRSDRRPPAERQEGYRDRDGIWRQWPDARRGNGSGKVPPGWCRGVGNPHNTPENCGYRSSNRPNDWYRIDRRGRDRDVRSEVGGRFSHESDHSRFHRELDARYVRLAAQRPADLRYQLELRARKQAEHDEWHRRAGVRH